MTNVQALVNERAYADNIPPERDRQTDNFFTADPNIQYLLRRYLPPHFQAWAARELGRMGALAAGPMDERAAFTDREGKPRLRKYNRLGEDISEIITNDGYKQTAAEVYGAGIVHYLYHPVPEVGEKAPYLYSYLMGYLVSQTEPGFYCPVTLTMSAAYLVDRFGSQELKERYGKGLTSKEYDSLYEGATWLTERQGGSDVGANATVAVPVEGRPGVYQLTGEKFFASNAGAMVATVLARVNPERPGTKGLGLFLVPWIKPNGEKNSISVRRLKEKLGVNAVPSAEVLLEGAEGYLIGEAENGFRYMAEALNISRICNAVASVGIMRRAFHEARYYAAYRQAFGAPITDFPMVRDMLVSLLLNAEASTGAVFDMIHYYDKVQTYGSATEEERRLARVLIPLLKYRTGEEAISSAHTAIEVHGGNGYIEEYVTPRLLRDAQVLTVWEGTANILGLDLLRVMRKEEGHVAFDRLIRERVRQWKQPLSQPFARRLLEEADQLRENVAWLMQQPEAYITYKCKTIADQMVDLYTLSCLVDEAEDQLAQEGNARKYLLAQLYWHKHFAVKPDRGLRGDHMLDVRFFQELVDYGFVPEERAKPFLPA
ncbi:isovaleryl-CoA dehydrogenase [Brevibacillus sp. SYP-B805]|uniref:acyl-CoA dehydrogenase family protein n=1 Tax=Brevibacillus sp. SYP-B805 TaxID=1578199 RepID=UPI0013EC24D0|nr:acyl-CoA dehydrogenase family protein [Brevibacillus sp. SYP-B805]NGQ97456.1 isovaleryl-CoA dehydrogenase [Brevibacillus sp. SYP-B805]